jgi:hypothetical protein
MSLMDPAAAELNDKRLKRVLVLQLLISIGGVILQSFCFRWYNMVGSVFGVLCVVAAYTGLKQRKKTILQIVSTKASENCRSCQVFNQRIHSDPPPPLSVTCLLPVGLSVCRSVVCCLSSAVCRLSSVVGRLSSVVVCLSLQSQICLL